jgi:hypothetical protein
MRHWLFTTYDSTAADFPITDLLPYTECLKPLEAYLHPEGLACPQSESTERRLFRKQGYFPAYRLWGYSSKKSNLTESSRG